MAVSSATYSGSIADTLNPIKTTLKDDVVGTWQQVLDEIGLDRGLSGPLLEPSAYFMKSPPVQYYDDQARDMVEEFIVEG